MSKFTTLTELLEFESDLEDIIKVYEEIRLEGKYNMFTEAKKVLNEMNTKLDFDLDLSDYFGILENYTYLKENFLK